MARVEDVARFFIGLSSDQAQMEQGDLMTNLRLQKLLYFAQGWHLARYGRPLFEDEIEAWRFGPVVRSVYAAYKRSGKNGIDGSLPDPGVFTEEEYKLLLDVAREYERFGTSRLVAMTHVPGSPWAVSGEHSVISKDLIQAYFAKQASLPAFHDDPLQDAFTPERDENGVAVIPADFAEGWDEDGDEDD